MSLKLNDERSFDNDQESLFFQIMIHFPVSIRQRISNPKVVCIDNIKDICK